MTKKEQILSMFNEIPVGTSLTKGDLFRKALSVIPNLSAATLGWIFSLCLVVTGRVKMIDKTASGAHIYRKIY